MNFALYSSNWTDMSIKFKKLLLFTMRMNNAENLKMQISMNKMVNMEMFADVRTILYSNCIDLSYFTVDNLITR